ncbi:MAG: hypothetical protein HFJ87_05995 [Muribaculaceae bacterium]|nr:hypothetical protein [Muribaculaceae bacterium]
MKIPALRRRHYDTTALVLLVGLIVLWIPWLGDTPFYSKGEPREAVVAMSILQNGDWILPPVLGGEIPYKPPFLAWLIAIFAWIFNGGVVNEFVSRLPSAIAAIAMVMMGYRWGKHVQNKHFALTMALVTATSFEVFRAAEACRVDMVLTAAMVGAIYILYEIRERRGADNVGWYAAAAVLLSIATLTKGPVGALLPCLAVGIWRLLRGDNFWRVLGSLSLLAVVSLMLPALWYYAAWKRGGDTLIDIAWEENIGRLTGTMSYGSHVKPFWYNFLTILAGMLPWTLLAVLALFRARTYRHWPFRPAGLLAVTTALTVIIFYCIPVSKRSVYLLPAYPFMAYGVAVIIESLRGTASNRVFGHFMAFLAVACPVAIAAMDLFPLPALPHFALRHWWSWLMLLLPVAVAAWWYLGHPRSDVGMPCIWALLVAYNAVVMPAMFGNPLRSADDMARFEALRESRAKVYSLGTPNNLNVVYWFNYYLDDSVRLVPTPEAADSLPTGSTLILVNPADTARVHGFTFAIITRNPDTRRPAIFATKK